MKVLCVFRSPKNEGQRQWMELESKSATLETTLQHPLCKANMFPNIQIILNVDHPLFYFRHLRRVTRSYETFNDVPIHKFRHAVLGIFRRWVCDPCWRVTHLMIEKVNKSTCRNLVSINSYYVSLGIGGWSTLFNMLLLCPFTSAGVERANTSLR